MPRDQRRAGGGGYRRRSVLRGFRRRMGCARTTGKQEQIAQYQPCPRRRPRSHPACRIHGAQNSEGRPSRVRETASPARRPPLGTGRRLAVVPKACVVPTRLTRAGACAARVLHDALHRSPSIARLADVDLLQKTRLAVWLPQAGQNRSHPRSVQSRAPSRSGSAFGIAAHVCRAHGPTHSHQAGRTADSSRSHVRADRQRPNLRGVRSIAARGCAFCQPPKRSARASCLTHAIDDATLETRGSSVSHCVSGTQQQSAQQPETATLRWHKL